MRHDPAIKIKCAKKVAEAERDRTENGTGFFGER